MSYDKSFVSSKVFDCMISSLFIILEKLDLRTKQRLFQNENGEDEEFYFCDPNIELCPAKPRDFHIFFNLVEFYNDIFKSNFKRDYFCKWMEEYCLCMVRYYNMNPLISGFLKLLGCALNVGDLSICTQNEHFRNTLSFFLKHIVKRSLIFRGEIQQSCIELIFKYPVDFYKNNINELVKVFKAAFDLGKTNMRIAKSTINALIKLYTCYENTNIDMKYFCENVFPHLNTFLENQPEEPNLLTKKRLKKEVIKHVVDSNIFILQKIIINFLGKLDQDTAALIISRPYKNLTKWNSNLVVEINLKLTDLEPSLYLDSLLPKMCYLAMTSTDRQTKVTSCEFVHTYVIYLMGRRCLSGLDWEHTLNTILILGSDNDITINEMFKPLLTQIMHYMSKQENISTEGVRTLLNCLMEGISNNSNNSIRDLSALCLKEFVEWSLRQATPEQLDSSQASIKGKFSK